MKTLYSGPFKAVAVFLTTVFLSIASALLIFIMVIESKNFYKSDIDQLKFNVLEEKLDTYTNEILTSYQNSPSKTASLSNYAKFENLYFEIDDTSKDYHYKNYTDLGNTVADKCTVSEVDGGQIVINAYIPKELKYNDAIKRFIILYDLAYSIRYKAIIYFVISALLGLIIYIYLFFASGHKKDGIYESFFDKIPFDVFTFAFFFIFSTLAAGLLYANHIDIFLYKILLIMFILPAFYLFLIWYTLSIAKRIKVGKLFKNTLIVIIYKAIKQLLESLFYTKQIPSYFAIGIIGTVILYNIDSFAGISFGCVYTGVMAVKISRILSDINTLDKALQNMKKGDYTFKINTTKMLPTSKRIAEEIETMGANMNEVVEEKVRGERFKAELITNVSHDLKTPLCSIISYTDLIEKENTDNKNIKNYVEVLKRQSQRIKKLCEDIVEASKISSGSISIGFEKIDFSELSTQCLGDYQDRYDAKNLELVTTVPNTPVMISADGQKLWRVIDNLQSNIIKYSLENTRVYAELKEENGKAIFSIKNVSKEKLNVDTEHLADRFTRGDASRNSDGSGLGLSIARDLTHLMNGTFDISSDGDLFRVTVSFDTV